MGALGIGKTGKAAHLKVFLANAIKVHLCQSIKVFYFIFILVNITMKGYYKTIGCEGPLNVPVKDGQFTQTFTTTLYEEVKATVTLTATIGSDVKGTAVSIWNGILALILKVYIV